MVSPAPNPYDEVVYLSHPQEHAHPDRLATLGRLHGVEAPPIESCRVLEVGCGTGGHLIPCAYTLPGAQFVGLDLAERPIELGRAVIRELGLTNIRLEAQDLMEVTRELGEFHYILAHGFYAWVPAPVRDKLLEVCRAHLAPNGVAMVSYNALPGGHLRWMIRDMILYHTRFIESPLEKAEQGCALLEFLAASLPQTDPYRALLQKELEHVRKVGAWLLRHDELAEFWQPVYFWQFMEHAHQHGLQYLSETEFGEMQQGIFKPEVAETLRELGEDILAREQYWDFLKCRKFRQTLLCHREVKIERSVRIGDVARFRFAGLARPLAAEPSIRSARAEKFQAHEGRASIETENPLAKAALYRLWQVFPRYPTFDELLGDVRDMLNPGLRHDGSPEDLAGERQVRKALSEILLKTFAANLVEFHVWQPPAVAQAGDRPEVFPLARLQAREDDTVSSLRLTSVKAEHPLTRALIMAADGTRDRAALAEVLAAQAGIGDGDERAALAAQVDENLRYLARQALLVA